MQLVLCVLSGTYHFHTASIVFVILFFSLLILVLSVWHKGIGSVLSKIGVSKHFDCIAMCFEESVTLQFLVFLKVIVSHLDLPQATFAPFSSFKGRPNMLENVATNVFV